MIFLRCMFVPQVYALKFKQQHINDLADNTKSFIMLFVIIAEEVYMCFFYFGCPGMYISHSKTLKSKRHFLDFTI